VLVPHLLQQVLGAQKSRARPQQRLEHAEFLDRQIELLAVAADGTPHLVEFDPADPQRPAARRGLTPGQGPDPENKLGKVERLGEIVVRAQLESRDPVASRSGRCQHEDHRPASVNPGAIGDHLAQCVAGDARQVAVKHHHVVGVEVQLGGRLEAVVRCVDGHPLIPQALDQHVRQ